MYLKKKFLIPILYFLKIISFSFMVFFIAAQIVLASNTSSRSQKYNLKNKIKTFTIGPSIILHNANVITMDDQMPNAQAVAIEGNLILAIGTDDEVLALQTANTQLFDLQGRTVVPGLIEAHSHRLIHAFWGGGPEGLVQTTQVMAADGFTTVHEVFGDQDFITWLQSLAQEGRLAVRINGYIPYNSNCGDNKVPWMIQPYTEKKDTTLRVVGVKIFADGGSCGYSALTTLWQAGPAAGTHGDLFKTQAEMNTAVAEVLNAGYPIAMHALGDSAVVVGLNAFENSFAGGGNTKRCRMEHLRVMREDLADQMAALGIAASIQFTWAKANSAARHESYYLPQVLEWVFPWRRMADRGIPIVGGNDFPYTTRTQAMQTISILATRKMQRDEKVPDWMNSDQLTVEQGLRAMTVTNAWVAFEDKVKGTITPGKLADLAVLSDDPLSTDPFDVRYINIEMTLMDGIVRHNQIDKVRNAIHDAGTFSMGIDDRGLWGSIRSHLGLQFNGIEQMYQGSLLISYDSSTVATATFRQQDYVTSQGGWVNFLEPGTIADEEATVFYEDASTGHPSSLRVKQESFMWQSDPLLLVKYTFENTHDYSVSDIYLGQFMVLEISGLERDWTSYLDDMVGWEDNQGLGFAYMYDDDATAPYIGVAMFNHSGNYANNSLAFTAGYRIDRGGDELRFSKTMRNGIIETEANSPGSYSILMSAGPFAIDANQSISPFMVAFVVGENLDDLKNAVNQSYIRSTSLTWIDTRQIEAPNRFYLFQNYPNPFNPTTTINYQLPRETIVNLSIFNISGQLVETLVNESQKAGFHKVLWNADHFNSGVYFYRIRAGEFRKVKKCLIIK